jgi:proteic killer suppression protein
VRLELSNTARKQLTKVPKHILRKFAIWADLIRVDGLDAAKALPGFKDHALKGKWKGYRAIRLSQAYRAIYIIHDNDSIETVYVEEVNKHEY